jgi:hypothetical protein
VATKVVVIDPYEKSKGERREEKRVLVCQNWIFSLNLWRQKTV